MRCGLVGLGELPFAQLVSSAEASGLELTDERTIEGAFEIAFDGRLAASGLLQPESHRSSTRDT